jgi:hypothetical protein
MRPWNVDPFGSLGVLLIVLGLLLVIVAVAK